MIGKTLATMTALALTGTIALAAGPGHGRDDRHGRGERGERFARLAEELQLTEAQIGSLQQMRKADAEQRRAHREEARALARQWVELRDKGDAKGAEKLQKQLAAMKEEAQIRRLAGEGKLESVLTDAQKQKLEQMRAERLERGMRRGPGRDGDGPDGPPED